MEERGCTSEHVLQLGLVGVVTDRSEGRHSDMHWQVVLNEGKKAAIVEFYTK